MGSYRLHASAKKQLFFGSFLAFALSVIAGTLLWAVSIDNTRHATVRAAGCEPNSILVNPCRPWLAASVGKYTVDAQGHPLANDLKTQVLYHEQRIGRQLDAVKVYLQYGQLPNSDQTFFANRANTFLMLNWKAAPSWVVGSDRTNTTENTYIDSMADAINAIGQASGNKVFLTIWHEPEDDVSVDTSGPGGTACAVLKGAAGSAANYVDMWHNIHDRFAAKGVTNVVYAMDYMNYAPWDCLIDQLYPGDNYVDWIVFNNYGGKNGISYADNLARFYNLLTNNSDSPTHLNPDHNYTSHPWGIAEWSARQTTQTQGITYIQQAQALANAPADNNTFPNLHSYLLFDNVGPEGNENRISYDIGGVFDPLKMDAYRTFANSAVFNVNTPPVVPDTTAPVVELTVPDSDATVTGAVAITATASDDTAVTHVEFYADNGLISDDIDGSDGYSANWDSTSVGDDTHVLKAIAYDAAGNSAQATRSVATDNTPHVPQLPTIDSFVAMPALVSTGSFSTLSWATTGADSCTVTPAGPVDTTSTSWQTDALGASQTYTLTCVNAQGSASSTLQVTVMDVPTIESFTATPQTVPAGASANLTWSVTSADSCSVTPGGPVGTTDTSWQTVALNASQDFTLSCANALGAAAATVHITVVNPPTIQSFTASLATITKGGTTTLSWATTGADSCTVTPGGPVDTTSTSWQTGALNASQVFTLTCTNLGGQVSGTVSVTALDPPVISSLTATPPAVYSGANSVLSWTTTGTSNCSVTPAGPTNTTVTTWQTPPLLLLGTTVYTLTCQNAVGATTSSTVSITVSQVPTPPKPTNVVLTSDKQQVPSGKVINFSWTSTGSDSCTLSPTAYTASGTSGALAVTITKAATYTVTCQNAGGSTTSNSIKVTIGVTPPTILTFYADPATVPFHTPTHLYWTTSDVMAAGCAISPSPQDAIYPNGKWATPKLDNTITYTLTCKNSAGVTASKTTTVVVTH